MSPIITTTTNQQLLTSAVSFLLVGVVVGFFADRTLAQPSQAQQNAIDQQIAAEKAAREARQKFNNDQISGLTSQHSEAGRSMVSRQQILLNYTETVYRKPTKKEAEAVFVDPKDMVDQNASGFSGDTKWVRLIPFVNCQGGVYETPETRAHCSKYSMPGNGSSYSFRESTYRIPRLADLSLDEKEHIKAGSHLTISFLVDLGLQSSNTVRLNSPGMRFLSEYRAALAESDVNRDWENFDHGISFDGFTYSRRLPLKVGHTFALRTVAYRGKSLQEAYGIVFNEFDYDKRADQIVVFTIRKAGDGNGLVVNWRLLRNGPSPQYKK